MKFGIGAKFALLATVLVCATAFLLVWHMRSGASKIVLDHEVVDLGDETRLRAWELMSEIYTVRGDVYDLCRRKEVQQIVGAAPDDRQRAALEDICKAQFFRSNYLWLEIVAIDGVAVDGEDGETTVVQLREPPNPPEDFRPVTSISNRDEFLAQVKSHLPQRPEEDQPIVSEIRRVEVGRAGSPQPGRANVVWSGWHLTQPGNPSGSRHAAVIIAMDLNANPPGGADRSDTSSLATMTRSPRHRAILANEPDRASNFDVRLLICPDDADVQPIRAGDLVEPFRNLFVQRDELKEICRKLKPPTEPRQVINSAAQRTKLQKPVWFVQSSPLPVDRRAAAAEALTEFLHESARQNGERVGGVTEGADNICLLAYSDKDLRRLAREVGNLPGMEVRWQQVVRCDVCYVDFVLFPVRSADSKGGRRYFGLAQAAFEEEMQADVSEELAALNWRAVAFVLAVAGIGFFCSLYFTRPLKRITATAKAVADVRGDTNPADSSWHKGVTQIVKDLPVKRRDEIGVLARAFREMLEEVVDGHERLRHLNADLDRRVRRRTEELQQANQELIAARDMAQELGRAKDAFLASVSHELRNPLNQVSGFCQLLELTDLDEEQLADLQKIRGAGTQLLALINDILDYQKIVMGGVKLEPEEIQVGKLVQEIGDAMEFQWKENANTLEIQCDDDVGVLYADEQRVRQILLNLMGNSCKFTQNGTVRLRAARQRQDGSDLIRFDVSDTGRGMTPEEQSKLFQPFSKLASKQGNKSGTGLGLVICKGFCEMMRGEITMHSEFGKGTTFTVRLPVDTSQGPAIRPPSEVDPVQTGAEPPEQTAEAPDPAATQNGRRPFAAFKRPADAAEAAAGLPADTARVVLVVDDDPAVREMMQRHLELQGFRVVTAADGFEALALAKQLRPAVITLDAIMPGLDGWAVLAALRTNAETSGIPVVMVTIDDNEERGFSLGAAEFVTKPIDWEQLSQILATYTGNKRDRSILVVDDEPEAREILRRNLERDGWEVLEAPHGSAALEVLATERPAAILLDLTMPVMDGFEFLAQYCQLAEWLAIPVLVITAKDPTPEEMEQLDGLVVRVLRKGQYNNEDLLKEIHRRVDKHIKSDTLEIKEEYDVAHPVG